MPAVQYKKPYEAQSLPKRRRVLDALEQSIHERKLTSDSHFVSSDGCPAGVHLDKCPAWQRAFRRYHTAQCYILGTTVGYLTKEARTR